jgi:hypothetical protein
VVLPGAVITMNVVLNGTLNNGGTSRFLQTAKTIGRAIQAEVQLMKLKSKDRKAWSRLATTNSKLFVLTSKARIALNEAAWSESVLVR